MVAQVIMSDTSCPVASHLINDSGQSPVAS